MDFEITPQDVAAKRERGEELVLLDVREPWEYTTAHIDGSAHIPMNEIPNRVGELDPEQHIVVMCHAGVRSAHVTEWLRRNGYTNVQSMAGGIDAWSRTVDPSLPRY
jgi:rhodanese-related sulfurtransferase